MICATCDEGLRRRFLARSGGCHAHAVHSRSFKGRHPVRETDLLDRRARVGLS